MDRTSHAAIAKGRGFVYACDNQLYRQAKTRESVMYLKCYTVRCDGLAKIENGELKLLKLILFLFFAHNFMSCNFMSCNFNLTVRHFHVRHFQSIPFRVHSTFHTCFISQSTEICVWQTGSDRILEGRSKFEPSIAKSCVRNWIGITKITNWVVVERIY